MTVILMWCVLFINWLYENKHMDQIMKLPFCTIIYDCAPVQPFKASAAAVILPLYRHNHTFVSSTWCVRWIRLLIKSDTHNFIKLFLQHSVQTEAITERTCTTLQSNKNVRIVLCENYINLNTVSCGVCNWHLYLLYLSILPSTMTRMVSLYGLHI